MTSSRSSDPALEFFIGLDLGQIHDPTAIAILARHVVPGDLSRITYQWETVTRRSFRHLQRLPLGMPYPDIAEHVRELVSHPELQNRATLIVDATGVGRPVVDLLHQAGLPCKIMPVTITGGDTESSHGRDWRVPKRDLINGLLVLFQQSKIEICGQLPEAETLVRELGNMRLKISLDGHESYGAWRESEHDDLVFAAALACWRCLAVERITKPAHGRLFW